MPTAGPGSARVRMGLRTNPMACPGSGPPLRRLRPGTSGWLSRGVAQRRPRQLLCGGELCGRRWSLLRDRHDGEAVPACSDELMAGRSPVRIDTNATDLLKSVRRVVLALDVRLLALGDRVHEPLEGPRLGIEHDGGFLREWLAGQRRSVAAVNQARGLARQHDRRRPGADEPGHGGTDTSGARRGELTGGTRRSVLGTAATRSQQQADSDRHKAGDDEAAQLAPFPARRGPIQCAHSVHVSSQACSSSVSIPPAVVVMPTALATRSGGSYGDGQRADGRSAMRDLRRREE